MTMSTRTYAHHRFVAIALAYLRFSLCDNSYGSEGQQVKLYTASSIGVVAAAETSVVQSSSLSRLRRVRLRRVKQDDQEEDVIPLETEYQDESENDGLYDDVYAAAAHNISHYFTDLKDIRNPSWEELKGIIPVGSDSYGPAYGSTIAVNAGLVRGDSEYGNRPIRVQNRKIHSCTGSYIPRAYFQRQTRWYQEDGNTQIYRMFAGDDNVRNSRGNAPRIESFSTTTWSAGDGWHEFSARYTFLQVRYGAIFQIKHDSVYWSMQLTLQSNPYDPHNYDMYYVKLRDSGAKTLLASNVLGESYDVKVLDNGNEHIVYIDGEERVRNTMTPSERVGGAGADGTDDVNHARWGLYSPTRPMDRDVLLFVTGAYVGVATTPPTEDGEESANSDTMNAFEVSDAEDGSETSTNDLEVFYNMKEPSNKLIKKWYGDDAGIVDGDTFDQGYI